MCVCVCFKEEGHRWVQRALNSKHTETVLYLTYTQFTKNCIHVLHMWQIFLPNCIQWIEPSLYNLLWKLLLWFLVMCPSFVCRAWRSHSKVFHPRFCNSLLNSLQFIQLPCMQQYRTEFVKRLDNLHGPMNPRESRPQLLSFFWEQSNTQVSHGKLPQVQNAFQHLKSENDLRADTTGSEHDWCMMSVLWKTLDHRSSCLRNNN